MYGKFNTKNVLVQKQPYSQKGFKEIPDDAICGQIKQPDGSFKNPEPIPEPSPTITDLLMETEKMSVIAEKLEEVIDFIENATPLSQETKDWVSNRKTIRKK